MTRSWHVHSPGPAHRLQVITDTGAPVCSICKGEGDEADARLIAAAPELLEACREVIRTGLLEEAMHGDQRAAVALCASALAAATGAA